MEITEALQAMKGKNTLMDKKIQLAESSHNNLNELVAEMLEQYYEPELEHDKENSNKSRLNKMFTKEVMNCLVKYAKIKGIVIKQFGVIL